MVYQSLSEPWIIDFGTAKEIKRVGDQNTNIGSPAFKAPEVLSFGRVGTYSDIYSLAATVLRLTCKVTTETSWQEISAAFSCTWKFGKIINKMIHPNYEERYSNCEDIIKDFREFDTGREKFLQGMGLINLGKIKEGTLLLKESDELFNYPPASLILYLISSGGFGVYKKQPQEQIHFYLGRTKTFGDFFVRDKLRNGDAASNFHLACCQEYGVGGEQSCFPAAVLLYQNAAEQGYAPAQFHLGLCYSTGRDQDKKKAISYFKMAAKQNFPLAHYHLGVHYSGQKHSNSAFAHFKKAAEHGHTESQFILCNTYGDMLKDKKIVAEYYKQVCSYPTTELLLKSLFLLGSSAVKSLLFPNSRLPPPRLLWPLAESYLCVCTPSAWLHFEPGFNFQAIPNR